MWDSFKSWLAVSPVASGVRTAFALAVVSGLNFVSGHYLSWDLPVWAQFALASAIPPVIRYFNDHDGIWGLGTSTPDPEAA